MRTALPLRQSITVTGLTLMRYPHALDYLFLILSLQGLGLERKKSTHLLY